MTEPDVDDGVDLGIDVATPAELDDDELGRVLEALMLVVDTPISAEALASATAQPVARITAKLRTMADELTARQSGICLLYTSPSPRDRS